LLELSAADETSDQRDHEQDDEHPEENPGTVHSDAGHTAKPDSGCDEGDYQKDNRVMKQAPHFFVSSLLPKYARISARAAW
jgi:hypothetical protein